MYKEHREPLLKRLKTLVRGKSHNLQDPLLFHRLSLIAIFAWVGLGSDALSSSAYGPQEAFLALGQHHYLAIFVALFIAFTIFVITMSYSQIVELFPHGGGGYLVASKLLSPTCGMISGCALLVDYVLTITVSIASGADAVFSFLPIEWQGFRLWFAVLCIFILILLNLRGVKESVLPLVPIFLLFIVTHIFAILYAIFTHVNSFPTIAQSSVVDFKGAAANVGFIGVMFIILHAYSMGAGTYTGIEAVSNGMPILREPKVKTAKKTMRYMAISLIFMVVGLMAAYLLYGIQPQNGKTMNAVFFETMTQNWGIHSSYIFVLLSLVADAALLLVAAQTGFLDGPRVLSNMAIDKWVPTSFASLSDRLVTQKGVFLMGGSALILMLLTHGSLTFLVVLYSIAVFITFLLSQAGMVRHWWISRSQVDGWQKKLFVNGIGLILTTFILISVVTLKFYEGGWITLLILILVILVVLAIKRHYNYAKTLSQELDYLVTTATLPNSKCFLEICDNKDKGRKFDPNDRTALVFVKEYNGLGLKTLSDIFYLFGDSFKNFIFIEIGIIEADIFKGTEGIKLLDTKVKEDVKRYVQLVEKYGYHGEGITRLGTDVVDEVIKIAPKIIAHHPNSIFFGGQIVFPNENLSTKVLHNYTVFALQEKLYKKGIPFIILPVNL